MIKRLQVVYPSGSVRVISDNAKYEFVELPQDQVRINGKTPYVWIGAPEDLKKGSSGLSVLV